MRFSITENVIKITLLSISIFTTLNAKDADGGTEKSRFDTNAQELSPSTPTGFDTNYDESFETYPVWIDPHWMYRDWRYSAEEYPNDMPPSKKINNAFKKHWKILVNGHLPFIAQSYLTLGDAHMDHLGYIQEHYYAIALNIGCQINDVEITEKAYIALGNMICGDQKCLESAVWYFEAFRLRKSGHIRDLAQKKTEQIKRSLENENTRNSLDAYQKEAIKEFFPQLGSLYLP